MERYGTICDSCVMVHICMIALYIYDLLFQCGYIPGTINRRKGGKYLHLDIIN